MRPRYAPVMAKRDKLRDRLERVWRSGMKAKEGHERTAEGKEVPTPTRGEFLGNLKRVIKPKH